jgi:quercetin dioxygenase-like cupin family protein
MPNLIHSEDMIVTGSGEGWQELTLADAQTFGATAMIARRWIFEPGARGPELQHGDVDQLLFVIRGGGEAIVDGVTMRLSEESMLWLEAGERFQFAAGTDGLEILQGYAPDA